MLLTVDDFRTRVYAGLDGLVHDLERHTRRSTDAERTAWRNSLPTLAEVLKHESLGDLHIRLGPAPGLILEYRLPSSPSMADAVLLGRGPSGPAALIVELKDWTTRGDQPGSRPGLVLHQNRETSHPSDQVKGYVDWCRLYHSAVQDAKASVHGCAFFTFASDVAAYRAEPHAGLVGEFPIFARNGPDLSEHFPRFITDRLIGGDPEFAEAFEQGVYRQDRGFVVQVAATLRNRTTSPFVLLDGQREGFEKCMREVERILRPARPRVRRKTSEKSVIIIDGPPGSGKSAIAAHLWSAIASDQMIDGSVVLTTTSVSQRNNWEALFQRASGKSAARGMVIGANQYNPGLNQKWLAAERAAGHATEIPDWRANVARYRKHHDQLRHPDDHIAVSIVDEAHALIDPTAPGARGISASGWQLHAGPQAWHIIRGSRVSIFLLDGRQSYRDNETTSIEAIKRYAKDHGCKNVEVVSLHDTQFRCGGSREYVAWLEGALSDAPGDDSSGMPAGRRSTTTAWRQSNGGPFGFTIHDRLSAMDAALRSAISAGRTARLVASYARPWATKGVLNPHGLSASQMDFLLPDCRGAHPSWSRIWNFTPDEEYSTFIQAPDGSPIARDPLCEVGCPYVVRGFDFDEVGLVWLSDLVWRKDRWVVQPQHVHESALKLTRGRARRGDKRAQAELIERLKRGYRILLTRAIHGMHVWFEDAETEAHIREWLGA
jgi:hypothetical protein